MVLQLETVRIGNTDIHIIGAQHGFEISGSRVFQLSDSEKKQIKRFLSKNGFSPKNTVALLEGPSLKRALKVWNGLSGVDLSVASVKAPVESRATIMLSAGVTEKEFYKPIYRIRAPEKRGDVIFRNYLHASAVMQAKRLFPGHKIFLFQGYGHTDGTKRFLTDKDYFERYGQHLRIAPQAANLGRNALRGTRRYLKKLPAQRRKRK